jgi:hypothetical protein
MTREELVAWAANIGQYDHMVYVGKHITIRDVKEAVNVEHADLFGKGAEGPCCGKCPVYPRGCPDMQCQHDRLSEAFNGDTCTW